MILAILASMFIKTDKTETNVVNKPLLKGSRYQLYKALKQMHLGKPMLVCYKIPNLNTHLDDADVRKQFFDSIKSNDVWISSDNLKNLDPVLVPGTWFDGAVGALILKNKWCAPSDIAHWIPNIKIYTLTEEGRKSFTQACIWWGSLTVMGKILAVLME